MIARVTHALEKALASWSSTTDGDLREFFGQAATELHHAMAPSFAGVALVTRGVDDLGIVARPRGVSVLPDETLRGFLAETIASGGACRVKDHALDTVRFIDAHFRTSIVVVGRVPGTLGQGSEMVVWAGLLAGATPKLIAEIRALAEELSRWLESNATTLLATRESRRRVGEARGRVAEMTAVAHDARAPLASLSYLLSDLTRTHPFLADDARKIQAEISYINGLMEGFSPDARQRSSSKAACCDVVTAVRRVGARFARQALDAGISFSWDLPYGDASAVIDPLSLERALTNIVGNAIKHSGSREVRFEVAVEDRSVIARVVDSGGGIPRAVLERIALADSATDVAFDSIRAAAGWGVGLLSSKSLVERSGGVFRVSSVEGRTCVEIVTPSAEKAVTKESYEGTHAVASKPPPAYGSVDVIVIDDDVEHSESLTRILRRAGLITRSFSSVDAAHEFVTENPSIKIVCDAHMPDGGAERMLKALRGLHSVQSLAVMSGEADDESLYRFAALGASEFFAKPIDADRLQKWITRGDGSEATPPADSGSVWKRRFSA